MHYLENIPTRLLLWKSFKKSTPEDQEITLFLKKHFGIRPGNMYFYRKAFLHKSASIEIKEGVKESNERLEFLGDAVLDAAIASHLFKNYPYDDEGDLTRMKSKIVSRAHLNQLGRKLDIEPLLKYNAGQINFDTLCGNAFEAIIGAIYLDHGYKKTKQIIIEKILNQHVDFDIVKNEQNDYKGQLIIWSQKEKKKIDFKVLEEKDYGYKNEYRVSLLINKEFISEGEGTSKKRAEQDASEKGWKKMFGEDKI